LTGAAYEYHHHAPDFLAAGGTQAELDALNQICKANPRLAQVNPAIGALEGIVIRYAAQMTLDVTVTDEVFAQLQTHFNTTELVELTAAIATYNMVARFLVALGVSPEV
jgi:alkylhydroperoxidase family enzyme